MTNIGETDGRKRCFDKVMRKGEWENYVIR